MSQYIEVRSALDQYESIGKEIKLLQVKIRDLKKERNGCMDVVQKYFIETDNTAIKYKGKLYRIEQTTKLTSKLN